jgi:hypothetical protein
VGRILFQKQETLVGEVTNHCFQSVVISPISFISIRSASSQRHFNSFTNRSGWHLTALPTPRSPQHVLHVSNAILPARSSTWKTCFEQELAIWIELFINENASGKSESVKNYPYQQPEALSLHGRNP